MKTADRHKLIIKTVCFKTEFRAVFNFLEGRLIILYRPALVGGGGQSLYDGIQLIGR
jgi:hypothetical protein